MADFMAADEYASQLGTGGDPGQEALLQALTQIRQLQAKPLMSEHPISMFANALEGAGANLQGKPNPAIDRALAERAQQMDMLKTQGTMGLGLSNYKLSQSQLELERQRTQNQTTRENRADVLDRIKLQEAATDKMITNPNRAMRLYGYQQKMKLPIEYGGLPPGSNPEALANFTKTELDNANDQAVHLLTIGENPRDPVWGGRFAHVPVEQYAQAIAKNPLAGHSLLSKPGTVKDSLTNLRALIQSLPEGERTPLQARILSAIGTEGTPVNYGERFNSIGMELSADPAFGAFTPNKPTPQQALGINERMEERAYPGIPRLVQRIATEKDPTKKKALEAQKDYLVAEQAKAAGLRTAAVVEATPANASTQQHLSAYNDILTTIQEFKQFTPEQIDRYTGVLNNPAQRLKMLYQANAPTMLGGGKIDEDFARFESMMGLFQKGYFALGGKQLTPFEAMVARMSTPTGREKGGAKDMLAKIDYLEKFTKVSQQVTATLAATGKSKLADPDFFENLLKGAMLKAGMRLPSPGVVEPWRSMDEPGAGWRRP